MHHLIFVLIIAGAAGIGAQPNAVPKFEDYPVSQIYRGTLAEPKIVTTEERSYRTRIREGISKGWGTGTDRSSEFKPRPNFAGKMMVIQWRCGSPCLMMAMVDGETGTIYPPPISWGDGQDSLGLPLLMSAASGPDYVSLQFRPDSRLMVFAATPKQDNVSYTFYFLWEGERWKLLRRIPLRNE